MFNPLPCRDRGASGATDWIQRHQHHTQELRCLELQFDPAAVVPPNPRPRLHVLRIERRIAHHRDLKVLRQVRYLSDDDQEV